ncbi:DUF4142 domain-containing protein [Pirellulaceae bacterium SH449]
MKINQFAMAALVTIPFGGVVVAQQPPTRANNPRDVPTQKNRLSAQQSKEQTFADYLVITNKEQVAFSRLGQKHATNDAVKAFAKLLEKDHQACVDELKGFASKGATASLSESSRTTRQENGRSETNPLLAENRATDVTALKPSIPNSEVDFLQLYQEISEQCLKDGEEWLGKQEGIELDKCFIGMQIAKHAAMKSSLTVLDRHATGDVQGMIRKGLKMNAAHMQAAVKLMEDLAASDPTKVGVLPSK